MKLAQLGNYYSSSQGVLQADALTSYGDVKLDDYRVYGQVDDIYWAGPLSVALTGADTSKRALIYHKDDKRPTITAGGTTVEESGDYEPGILNLIVLQYNGSVVKAGFHPQPE